MAKSKQENAVAKARVAKYNEYIELLKKEISALEGQMLKIDSLEDIRRQKEIFKLENELEAKRNERNTYANRNGVAAIELSV